MLNRTIAIIYMFIYHLRVPFLAILLMCFSVFATSVTLTTLTEDDDWQCKVCWDQCFYLGNGEKLQPEHGFSNSNNYQSIRLQDQYGVKLQRSNKITYRYHDTIKPSDEGSYHGTSDTGLTRFQYYESAECLYIGDWRAILYADPDKKGHRIYVTPGETLTLSAMNLKNEISSVELYPESRLTYYTWNQEEWSKGS
ncbi:MAG: hypothetical protein HKN53_07420, partial [Maribacter sp.]|nr:hypothetical protein [Maribacter sp.]